MMKYVVFRNEETKQEEIMLFTPNIHHDCFVESVEYTRSQSYGNWRHVPRSPISAGFVVMRDGKPVCFSRSESLNLDSRKEDTILLCDLLDT